MIVIVKIGGGGRHIEYHMLHDPMAIKRYLQLQTATEFIYVVSVTVPKLTLLILYLKIFPHNIVRHLTWAMIVIVLLQWLIVGVIVWASICQPFRYKWDKNINGHCANLLASYRYFSIPNIITDIAILLLPVSTVWKLQVSKLQKLGIFLTFLAGGLGIIAALIRFVGFFTVDLNRDPTYYGVTTMLLSIAEPGAYFICSTLPYIRPLATKFYKRSGMATVVSRSRDGTNLHSRERSSKRRFPAPEQAKSSYSTTLSSWGPSAIDDDRVEYIDLVERVEVTSNRE
ncbi:uncharacterized protein BDR25DRAFT_230040 [Lindgomyces ingoldianus]|uniref:Uncharacterized protein n=1 Tax=Lindgomyces ingoldianus TaxID=673940 RepID=A0ACB6QPX2_9PLEO|nr:uncharacterized protein BDR25DRAFT_230040 [Lindgomyces ingoldianus]KAF2469064.1 hypothetical protein BDR25DRAFT_230040 [Lindgomyces ingoldianus]